MSPTIKSRLKQYSYLITGDPEKFSLESRIFHTFSFFVLLILLFEAFFNISIHLYISAGLAFGVLGIQLMLYYLARVKNKLQIAVILSAIEVNVLKAFGYYFNDGITGATLLLFAASLFILMAVSKKRLWPFLLGFNLVVVLSIVMSEYWYPDIIKQHYHSRAEQFADNIVSYMVTVILLYVGTAAIRKNYTLQKNLTDEKNLALELLNAEKVKLFSIIAHDLRTPLASVQQYFTVITEVDLKPAERIELEKNLLITIGNTQELLTNLLKWAKNQMDGSTAYLRPLHLQSFLESTVTLFQNIAHKKDITLHIIVDESITITADADMLQLVIRNLLNNAVKFTHNNGHVTLKADIAESNCIITIADNGMGIPAHMHNDIFSLSLTSTPGTKNEEGTGLGLVLCKDYTELQGGSIRFTSTEGKGTTFYLSLPLYEN